ncbi:hypothetical protein Nepgr_031099 [Nepenthes gracilis]|uniref:Uncharacterized protein n=1 Tax=Nepenthes gracilis TaxID=150966 RepID=A0AAD3THU1_NEPGR|nr:hypothetical protein Nepgr_031099 [Nepenthes gracilis]
MHQSHPRKHPSSPTTSEAHLGVKLLDLRGCGIAITKQKGQAIAPPSLPHNFSARSKSSSELVASVISSFIK